jgi:hypothetical protein
MNSRITLVIFSFCLLCAAALSATRAAEPAKIATTHYVDNAKHITMDVPLTWERKFPENEDERIRFIFVTAGKSTPNAQPPEFTVVTTGPDAKDESLKSLAAFAAAVRKQDEADDKNAKFDKEKEVKLDGVPALSFGSSKKAKAGPAKLFHLVAIRDGIGYSISFACDPATFDAEYPGAKNVIDSWKWSK